ncbi:MAG: transposase [Chloroflexi bacterium]|nr:transposase [Chloroflexota bacterium]
MVRALLISSLYNIASFRRLCSAISENLAYRWSCFRTIDDPVFDHSSISHFINRIGWLHPVQKRHPCFGMRVQGPPRFAGPAAPATGFPGR